MSEWIVTLSWPNEEWHVYEASDELDAQRQYDKWFEKCCTNRKGSVQMAKVQKSFAGYVVF